jgi:ribonuclease HII
MKRAFEAMAASQTGSPLCGRLHAVADGLFAPDIPVPCEPLVKADAKVPAVMAASILAKTARDRLMEFYGLAYPQYGYEKHKGYPTKAHREAVLQHGPSPIQRISFNVS